MPSTTKKQQRFFKNVYAYQQKGAPAIAHLPFEVRDKIIKTSWKMEDLNTLKDMMMLKGEEPEIQEPRTEKKKIQIEVGMWALVKPTIKNTKGEQIQPFITKLSQVDRSKQTFNFKTEDAYGLDGVRRMPSKYFTGVGNEKVLDFGPLSWIKKTAKTKSELNEIRMIIRNILEEIDVSQNLNTKPQNWLWNNKLINKFKTVEKLKITPNTWTHLTSSEELMNLLKNGEKFVGKKEELSNFNIPDKGPFRTLINQRSPNFKKGSIFHGFGISPYMITTELPESAFQPNWNSKNYENLEDSQNVGVLKPEYRDSKYFKLWKRNKNGEYIPF